jgi:hypothetical protein
MFRRAATPFNGQIFRAIRDILAPPEVLGFPIHPNTERSDMRGLPPPGKPLPGLDDVGARVRLAAVTRSGMGEWPLDRGPFVQSERTHGAGTVGRSYPADKKN